MAPQERSKRAPRAPKSAQERPQSVPNPSQMEPKTLPKLIVKGFFALYFPIPNLHRFFVDVYVTFMLFLKARTFKFIAPVEAKRYFLQNRSFEENAKKTIQKPGRNPPKTFQNPVKIVKKSSKIDEKRQHDLRCVEKPKKIRKIAKKCKK